jgi:hypothetical protein
MGGGLPTASASALAGFRLSTLVLLRRPRDRRARRSGRALGDPPARFSPSGHVRRRLRGAGGRAGRRASQHLNVLSVFELSLARADSLSPAAARARESDRRTRGSMKGLGPPGRLAAGVQLFAAGETRARYISSIALPSAAPGASWRRRWSNTSNTSAASSSEISSIILCRRSREDTHPTIAP